ncbi:hypothetical protein Patl1_20547 [Pistacia atlantica]|uniref:Uncharacterized protein n=1 Tax=Pistacia atlantica TaxID=434234 RepID=A0ACC1BN95_9ROSI|nr:hypothetical protein Patl1_20547 [Pistacia atlantica]
MILEYDKAGYGDKAFEVFVHLLSCGFEPNDYTFTNIISASGENVGFEEGKQLHGVAIKYSLEREVSVGNALVTMYGKYGMVDEAERMFNSMNERNLISWTALMSGYVKSGHGGKAIKGFLELLDLGIFCDSSCLATVIEACSECRNLDFGVQFHGFLIKLGHLYDVSVGTGLVDLYAKCGNLKSARMLFNGMSGHNVVSWNAMLSAYALHGQGKKALLLFEEMKRQGFVPDEITILAVLQACIYSGLWEDGIFLFNEIEPIYGIKPILEHFTCMVDLLGRAGLLSEAMNLIKSSPYPHSPLLWRTLVQCL